MLIFGIVPLLLRWHTNLLQYRDDQEFPPRSVLLKESINAYLPPQTKVINIYSSNDKEPYVNGIWGQHSSAVSILTTYGTNLSQLEILKTYNEKLLTLGWIKGKNRYESYVPSQNKYHYRYEENNSFWCKDSLDFSITFSTDSANIKEELRYLHSDSNFPLIYHTDLVGSRITDCIQLKY